MFSKLQYSCIHYTVKSEPRKCWLKFYCLTAVHVPPTRLWTRHMVHAALLIFAFYSQEGKIRTKMGFCYSQRVWGGWLLFFVQHLSNGRGLRERKKKKKSWGTQGWADGSLSHRFNVTWQLKTHIQWHEYFSTFEKKNVTKFKSNPLCGLLESTLQLWWRGWGG